MTRLDPDTIRSLLNDLGVAVRDAVVAGRATAGGDELAGVEGRSSADTMYGIDRFGDEALLGWFDERWPERVVLVTESLDEPTVVGTGQGAPSWTVIVDPIDGTRGLMYDKRPAWVLSAAAPVASAASAARLGDVVVASMTEIPTTKQALADQYSAVRGNGVSGVRTDLGAGASRELAPRPSTAVDLEHGWASFARFFPAAKTLLAAFEDRLWRELYGEVRHDLAIFDDQYLATGGQFHELLAGHDRLLGDLRPLAFAELGLDGAAAIACHPYDCCTALLLEEAGCVITDPWGAALDAPLDTTTPVAWVGYANRALADRIAPSVRRAIDATFPAAGAASRGMTVTPPP